ncbi:sulfur carrier protein [Halobacillus karajensis]|uniref:Thiamine biosynthesis protein ThiS n=1 Tax=Halobacillus karajensis TaxID=195088 RepID=A0A024P833_9BACI|nr:sulfur carrier protein ThiS [Halobacillus karajensis]CDQ18166.1 Thiamine biosynthesis protein ThiS [Halobacillus karajensis]CDQ24517.1 Thiamine biosynthesis protein ThiS [Halobacillus karajensis]CDQ29235.1 Thiamine biosynthesis protein ThiS [Halobacillus karajensis]SEH58006.1 sulfur carrier protein [Halobacillus karajensis]
MNIQINGRSVDLSDKETTIADLLESYRIRNKIAVVERNKEIIHKADYENTKLSHGDTLEIIHFVGGG